MSLIAMEAPVLGKLLELKVSLHMEKPRGRTFEH